MIEYEDPAEPAEIAANYREKILYELGHARANPARVKQFADALRADGIVQIEGDIYDHKCGGMCVLGVAFATFYPEDFAKVLTWGDQLRVWEDAYEENKVDYTTRPTYPTGLAFDSWGQALTKGLKAKGGIDDSPFYGANDSGMSLAQIADILDEFVAAEERT